MKAKKLHILLALLALTLTASGQEIVSMQVDTVACLGDTVGVSIGFQPWRNIVLQNGVATLGSESDEFLPDGVVCDGKCSYESPVVFTDFTHGATITSAGDILYVRLNIEHSFLGDIYMGIKCPNGQRASLMNWAGTGTSACTDSVPSSHRGWSNAYTNTGGGTFLGEAYDYGGSPKCDSTVDGNEPGIGWNYCWSDNTTYGYSYANDDGLIYRASNASSHYNRAMNSTNTIVDSSNVAAHSNFYHPDQSFSNLIGCPLNGRWTIEVIDAYSSDNGYIFEWEMALDPSLLPTADSITGQAVVGSQVIDYTDSTFGVTAPTDATTDTTLPYYVYIFTALGDTVDTSFTVHYYTPYYHYSSDTLCTGDTAWWRGQPFTADTLVAFTGTTVHGCDSIIEARFVFNPIYDIPDTYYFCPNGNYVYLGHDYGGPIAFDTLFRTVEGCDSLVRVALVNSDTAFNLRILVSPDGQLWASDTTLHGCQPTTVWLRDTTPHVANRQWLLGDSDETYTDSLFSHTYDTLGLFSLRLTAVNNQGCTDTAYLPDAVHVHRNPTAEFEWENPLLVIHDATSRLRNLSTPVGDSLSYYWEIQTADGDFDTSTLFEPVYSWYDGSALVPEGDYEVDLYVYLTYIVGLQKDTLVCTDSISHSVAIINDFLDFPNLVTPNGDGNNDYWKVVNLLECGIYTVNELWIFNQWGIQVYNARDIGSEEDFWYPNTTSSPDGTYYFRFMARSPYGTIKRNGTIEVLRGE